MLIFHEVRVISSILPVCNGTWIAFNINNSSSVLQPAIGWSNFELTARVLILARSGNV